MIEQRIVRVFYNHGEHPSSSELEGSLKDNFIIKSINTKMTPETKWGVTKCIDVILLEKETKGKIKNKL